jgi:N-methylhydantoinase A
MLAGQRIALRCLDIGSIAAGGGSIASVDVGATLRVGPESAGSVPGPACYGKGGVAATVTDANVVLGYLDAAAFMGGGRPLDSAAAEAAVDRIAAALYLSRLEAAAGIYRMINLKMADGIRLTSARDRAEVISWQSTLKPSVDVSERDQRRCATVDHPHTWRGRRREPCAVCTRR